MSQRLSYGGTENTQHEGGGTLRVSVFPLRKLEIYVRSALECSALSGGDSFTSLFLDGGARLTVKSVEAELALTNLTNRRRYTKRTIVENDIYTYSYSLRPAECLLTVKFKL